MLCHVFKRSYHIFLLENEYGDNNFLYNCTRDVSALRAGCLFIFVIYILKLCCVYIV